MTKLHRRIFEVTSSTLTTTATLPSVIAHAFNQIDAELAQLVADAHFAVAES